MNQLIIGLVAVLVVIGGGYYLYNNRVAPTNGDSTIVTATTTVATTTASLADGAYSVDTLKSVANWEGRKVVLTKWIDQGTIKIASGTLAVSAGAVTDTKLVFDMNSIAVTLTGKNGGFDMLAKHLKSDDFFNATKYPTATFQATDLKLTPGTQQTITGKLTIRDTSKDIEVPVMVNMEGNQLVVVGSTTVDRSQFNVKYGSGKFFKNLGDNLIDDNFSLSFKVYFNQ